MVDPISEGERAAFNRRLIAGITLLVGVSAGLITLQIETTLLQTAGAVVIGLVFGYPLARFVAPTGPAPVERQRRRRARERENPFTDGGDGADDGDETDRDDSDRSHSSYYDRR